VPRMLVVAAGQTGPASDDRATNADTVIRLMDEAAGAKIICLPELSLTKYFGHWNTRDQTPLGGEVLARAKTDGTELVLAEIDLDDVAETRTRRPFPRDRRPEHYAALCQ
jgi:predicted amidohydrolase